MDNNNNSSNILYDSFSQLWRPFLDSSPLSLLSIHDIILDSICLPLNNDNERFIIRGLKLFSHFCTNSQLVYDLIHNNSIKYNFNILFDSIITKSMCIQDDIDPNIRQNAILVLCSLSIHSLFFDWLQKNISYIDIISSLILQRLDDSSFQVSEIAIEFLTRYLTASCYKLQNDYKQWEITLIKSLDIGEKLYLLIENNQKTSLQLVITNLIIELSCPITYHNSIKPHYILDDISLIRNYYRGRRFIYKYKLASTCLLYLNSNDRILRFRVIEMIESLSFYGFHFLLLSNNNYTEQEDIEFEVISIIDRLLQSHKKHMNYTQFILLHAQLSSALSFQNRNTSYIAISRLYLPSFIILLSNLFSICNIESFNIKPILSNNQSIKDITPLINILINGYLILAKRHGVLFLQNCNINLWKQSLLYNNSLDLSVSWIISDKFDIINILLSILQHPNLYSHTSTILICCKLLLYVIHKENHSIIWENTLKYYSNNEVNNINVFNIIIDLIQNEKIPCVVLSELYNILIDMFILIFQSFNNSNIILLKQIKECIELQIYNPNWERNDSAIQLIGSLFKINNEIIINTMKDLHYCKIVLDCLNIPNNYVRTSALHVLGIMSIHNTFKYSIIQEYFINNIHSFSYFINITQQYIPNKNNTDILSYLLASVYDTEDIYRREFINILSKWISNINWCNDIINYIKNPIHIQYIQNIFYQMTIEDIDWEVKKKSIELLKQLWIGFNKENLINFTLILCDCIKADELLLISSNDSDRIPRQATFECLYFIQQWFNNKSNKDQEIIISNKSERIVKFYTETLSNEINYFDKIQENTIEAIYPDETDLRYASTENDNPIGCY